nr:MAG TPA: hypothetical protein [Caudoviricetes sp.]
MWLSGLHMVESTGKALAWSAGAFLMFTGRRLSCGNI